MPPGDKGFGDVEEGVCEGSVVLSRGREDMNGVSSSEGRRTIVPVPVDCTVAMLRGLLKESVYCTIQLPFNWDDNVRTVVEVATLTYRSQFESLEFTPAPKVIMTGNG
jgi:hypothetical protein